MPMQIYHYAHDVLNIHFWDVPSIVVLVLMVVVAASHTYCQNRREKKYSEKDTISNSKVRRARALRGDAA